MDEQNNETHGDRLIDRPFRLTGMIVGNVRATEGALLQMNGMITGHLIVETGARVVIDGMVNGDVRNNGGHLIVRGMIDGTLHEVAGTTERSDRAAIGPRGRP